VPTRAAADGELEHLPAFTEIAVAQQHDGLSISYRSLPETTMGHSFDSRRLFRRSLAPLLLAAAVISPLAIAETAVAPPGMRGHHHGISEKTLEAIGATADQRAKILAIESQARADRQAQRQASGNARREMAQALAAPTVDPSAAEAARQKMLAQMDAASQRRLQARLMIAAVLTPEQRQQLLQMGQQRHRKS
jgi:Spy/CpxP family protein refolding chaperone